MRRTSSPMRGVHFEVSESRQKKMLAGHHPRAGTNVYCQYFDHQKHRSCNRKTHLKKVAE